MPKPPLAKGNWFGESMTKDNMDFTIQNMTYKLRPGPPVPVRFFVKYNQARTIPSVSVIRLNGRTICPARGGEERGPTNPKLHISRPKPTQTNGGSGERRDRPTSLSSGANGGNNRPSNNYNRPTERPGYNRRSGLDLSDTISNRVSCLIAIATSVHNVVKCSPASAAVYGTRPITALNEGKFLEKAFSALRLVSAEDYSSNSRSTLRPTSNSALNVDDETPSSHDFFQGDFGILTQNKPVGSRPVQHGSDWPWHAALYHSTGTELKYTCGGTLVAPQYVVTAAHCVTKPGTNNGVDPQYMLVYMGKHSLMAFGADVQDKTIAGIYVHPDYNYSVYFNDIAILKLSSPFEITNFVRTCCLWEEDLDLEEIIGRKGTSVCNGDSGSGMFFQKKRSGNENPAWQLRGLVSVGVALQGSGICDASQYVIFTDAAKYTGWIRRIIGSEN
ncbi:hypothetical protein NQ318_016547 [Aromia moschata]|uniref:Peptidase S1 domain-containing protein n=1 Tax=Aromia moschata TaxID=1265417 RepID=A0AAV8YYW4_9CUCU|nr:hypothetical protein NQ318_016547 [Aromia moschata]